MELCFQEINITLVIRQRGMLSAQLPCKSSRVWVWVATLPLTWDIVPGLSSRYRILRFHICHVEMIPCPLLEG